MKKITALLLALLMLFVFAACGASDKDDKKPDNKEEISTTLADDVEDTTSSTPNTDTSTSNPPAGDVSVTDMSAADTDEQKVAEYVTLYGSDIIAGFTSTMTNQGMTCIPTVRADGTNIVMDVRIQEFDNLPEAAIANAQLAFDSMKSVMTLAVSELKKELPSLNCLVLNMCEVDGDIIATLTVDGSETDNTVTTPTVEVPVTGTPNSADAQKVASFIALHEDELIDSFESSFTSAGMTCTTSLEIEGTGFILTVCINELENLTEDQKAQMQTTYDALSSTFSLSLDMMQTDIPELTYFKVLVCEKDGDHIATIVAQ